MSSYLANLARRGAGMAPRLGSRPAAVPRPVVPLMWGMHREPAPAGEIFETTTLHAAPPERGMTSPPPVVAARIAPEAAHPSPDATPDARSLPEPSPAPRARVTPVQRPAPAPQPVTMERAEIHPESAARQTAPSAPETIMAPRAEPARKPERLGEARSPERATVLPATVAPAFAPSLPPEARDARVEPAATAPRHPEMASPVPPPVMQPRIFAAERIPMVTPMPQTPAAPVEPAARVKAGREPSAVQVKIGKIEVRAPQSRQPIRVARPRAATGFSDMALRRAWVDRIYR